MPTLAPKGNVSTATLQKGHATHVPLSINQSDDKIN
jgi:hypothetical protein